MQALRLIFATIVLLSVVGCQNTVQGFGKDMQRTGGDIQRSVQ